MSIQKYSFFLFDLHICKVLLLCQLPKATKSERRNLKIYLINKRYISWKIRISRHNHLLMFLGIFNLLILIHVLKLNPLFLLAQDPLVKITLYIEVFFYFFLQGMKGEGERGNKISSEGMAELKNQSQTKKISGPATSSGCLIKSLNSYTRSE